MHVTIGLANTGVPREVGLGVLAIHWILGIFLIV